MANCRRRWVEAQTSNLYEDLTKSGLISEEDHLNNNKLTALYVVMPIHYLVYGNVKFDPNILKMDMCANI